VKIAAPRTNERPRTRQERQCFREAAELVEKGRAREEARALDLNLVAKTGLDPLLRDRQQLMPEKKKPAKKT